jgi:hypothetical protein
MVRSGPMPASASAASSSPSTARPDDSPGSFCASGAMKLYGYQLDPAAWGAR